VEKDGGVYYKKNCGISHSAIKNGHLEIAKYLVEKADFAPDSYVGILKQVVYNGGMEFIKFLTKNGVSICEYKSDLKDYHCDPFHFS
jgi:hypothetical protein